MTTRNLIIDQYAPAAPSTLGWISAGDSIETGGVRSIQVGLLGTGAIAAVVSKTNKPAY